jgi:hypothetical protein
VRNISFCENNKGLGSKIRVMKRWEIPIEKIVLCVDVGSPRDSGAAKRVAELNGKRSYLCDELEKEDSVMVEDQEGFCLSGVEFFIIVFKF